MNQSGAGPDQRGFVARLTWPLPPWTVLLPALALATVSAAQAATVLSWNYIDWALLSSVPTSALTFSGPLAGAFAATVAATYRNPRTPLAIASAVRSGPNSALTHLRVLIPSWALSHGLGTLPFIFYGWLNADAHGPQVVLLTYSLIACSLFITLGYAAGTAIPSRMISLVVVLIAAPLALAPTSMSVAKPSLAAMLAPVPGGPFEVGLRATIDGWVWKSIAISGIAAFFALTAALFPGWRGMNRYFQVKSVALALAPLSLVCVSISIRPSLLDSDATLGRNCFLVQNVDVCLESSQVSVRNTVRNEIGVTLGLVGGPPDSLQGVVSDAIASRQVLPQLGTVRDTRPPPPIARLSLTPVADPATAVRTTLASYLAGRDSCYIVEDGIASARKGSTRAADIELYILDAQNPEASSEGQRFRAWYRENQESILQCDAPSLPSES